MLILSFFLSFSDLFLPVHCRCKELLLHMITFGDTHTHTHTQTHTSGQRIIDDNRYNLVYNKTNFVTNSYNIYNSTDTAVFALILEIDSVSTTSTALRNLYNS
jgi:hypothetical protein